MATGPPFADPVVVSADELWDDASDVCPRLLEAFGSGGLGLVLVSGVPGLPELREKLLPLAQAFARLPASSKNSCVDADSNYIVGWSHGVETLEGGRPDDRKGSFYANPLVDRPSEDPEELRRFPSVCRPNLWPEDDLPALREAFRALGSEVTRQGRRLAQRCDAAVAGAAGREPVDPVAAAGRTSRAGLLAAAISDDATPKGRLLHYFPPPEAEGDATPGDEAPGATDVEGSWCGWHVDTGTLTGLVSAMFLTPDGTEIPSPDSAAGLHVRTRGGRVVRVAIPPTCLAFQLGEAAQVASGGRLRATPHCVVAARPGLGAGVSRNTLAVFMQPRWDAQMRAPPGATVAQVDTPRWEPGLAFGDFAARTFKDLSARSTEDSEAEPSAAAAVAAAAASEARPVPIPV